jgi:hypothetical protein
MYTYAYIYIHTFMCRWSPWYVYADVPLFSFASVVCCNKLASVVCFNKLASVVCCVCGLLRLWFVASVVCCLREIIDLYISIIINWYIYKRIHVHMHKHTHICLYIHISVYTGIYTTYAHEYSHSHTLSLSYSCVDDNQFCAQVPRTKQHRALACTQVSLSCGCVVYVHISEPIVCVSIRACTWNVEVV